MRPALEGPGFAVFDGWLAPGPLAEVRSFLYRYRYFSVFTTGKRGPEGTLSELAPRLADGRLRLLGGKFVVLSAGARRETAQLDYPSRTPLDAVLESVERALPRLEPYLGRRGEDWQRLGAGPRLYPPGGGLAEHDDADSVGTFALYLHNEWREGWGGELEVGGLKVRPEPNRCSFLKGGTPHRVLPVGPDAGLRISVIGYAREVRKAAG